MRLLKRLTAALRKLDRIGFMSAFRLATSKILNDHKPIRIRFEKRSIYIRPLTTDLTVALSSLGSEFECLRAILPADHDGLIVDAGGYIGTAAIKLSEVSPERCEVTDV